MIQALRGLNLCEKERSGHNEAVNNANYTYT